MTDDAKPADDFSYLSTPLDVHTPSGVKLEIQFISSEGGIGQSLHQRRVKYYVHEPGVTDSPTLYYVLDERLLPIQNLSNLIEYTVSHYEQARTPPTIQERPTTS